MIVLRFTSGVLLRPFSIFLFLIYQSWHQASQKAFSVPESETLEYPIESFLDSGNEKLGTEQAV